MYTIIKYNYFYKGYSLRNTNYTTLRRIQITFVMLCNFTNFLKCINMYIHLKNENILIYSIKIMGNFLKQILSFESMHLNRALKIHFNSRKND